MSAVFQRLGVRLPDQAVVMARALGPTPTTRKLTMAERQSVLSGSGTIRRRPGGSYDPNPDLSGYRARGLWPNMGTFAGLPLREPIIATALERRKHWMTTRDYRLLEPPSPTRKERVFTEYAREQLDYLPGGGVPRLIEKISSRDQYGFSLLEVQLDVEGLEYRIGELPWLHPSTVTTWILDEAGNWTDIVQKSERGEVTIPRHGKLAHFARGDYGRNPEGVSLCRSVVYWVEAKGEAWRDYAESARRLGRGYLQAKIRGAAYGSQEWADARAMLDDFEDSDQRVLLINDAMDVAGAYLGSVLPDIAAVSAAFDYQISRGMDEQAQQLGAQDRGSRALGTMMDQAARRSLAGECGDICRQIDEQIIRPMMNLHPRFDDCRPPRFVARGLVDGQDLAVSNALWQALTSGHVPDEYRTQVAEHALRLTGAI